MKSPKPNVIGIKDGVWMLDLRGKTYSKILGMVSNGKKTLYFPTKVSAEKKAEEIEELLTSYGTKKLETLETIMRIDPIDLQQRLMPFKATVQEAVDFFIKMKSEEMERNKSHTLTTLIDQWLLEKKKRVEQNTMRYISYEGLFLRGRTFKKLWGNRPIATITKKEIQDAVTSLTVKVGDVGYTEASQVTKKHFLSKLSQFFIWCKNTHGIPRDNPCEGITVEINENSGDVTYFSVAEAKEIMDLATTTKWVSLLPYMAICMFSGVRATECSRLTWANIDIEDKTIILTKADAKTFGRRPEMQPNLVAWLQWFKAKYPQYPLIPKKGLLDRKKNFHKALNWKHGWAKNGLRHSAASYTLGGIKKDFAYLEANFGNSRQMLQSHYINFPNREESLKFWAIYPPK